jgi:proteasome lid subunit RPN8/RPN11
MQVLLPNKIASKLIRALRKAGHQEIGGILMGECLEADCFRIVDLTIQQQGGAFASFIRSISSTVVPLKRFFQRTNHEYQRFNYLGEWHSHPSFCTEPSARDIHTMWEMLDDPTVGANFLVLLIVRLNAAETLESTLTVFVPQQPPFQAEFKLENAE